VHVSNNKTVTPSSGTESTEAQSNKTWFYWSLVGSYIWFFGAAFTFANLVYLESSKKAYEAAGWSWDVDQDITSKKIQLAVFVGLTCVFIALTLIESRNLTRK